MHLPTQAKQGTNSGNMWAVVVLGILSAVFAWVWFGGRRSSETQDREVTAEAVHGSEQRTGVKCADRSSLASNEGETEEARPGTQPGGGGEEHVVSDALGVKPAARAEQHVPHREEATCSLTSEKRARQQVEGRFAAREEANASEEESVKAPLTPEEQPVLASREELSCCPAAREDQVSSEGGKLSYTLQETGSRMVHHTAALQDDQLRVPAEAGERLHASQVTYAPAPKAEERRGQAVCCSPDTKLPAHTADPHVINGEEPLVNAKEGNATVCLEDNFTEDSSSNITENVQDDKLREECRSLFKPSDSVSPKKVNISSENDFKQRGYMKLNSPVQSETNGLSDNQESTVGLQNNIAYDVAAIDHAASEVAHEELQNTQELEDKVLSQTTASVHSLLNVSCLEENNPDLEGASLSERSCFDSPSEARLQDGSSQRTKRVAAVQPMPQNVSLGFKVHYITDSDSQIIAVTGDHENLGGWEVYIPLTPEKDGLWSCSVTLPSDTEIEWKFVMVENGKIKRWEECSNRCLKTAHEDNAPQQWWGYL